MKDEAPIVLGVAPGIAVCGYAVLQGGEFYCPDGGLPIKPGIIRTEARDGNDAARISRILDALPNLPRVDVLAVERQHGAGGKNEAEIRGRAASAQRVAAVRGAVTAWAQARGVGQMVEVSPQKAKKALAGYGKASKQAMVAAARLRFRVKIGQDAADAVGMALVGEHECANVRLSDALESAGRGRGAV